ncbi:hypothetical protein D3C77_423960 [compost metagenome]
MTPVSDMTLESEVCHEMTAPRAPLVGSVKLVMTRLVPPIFRAFWTSATTFSSVVSGCLIPQIVSPAEEIAVNVIVSRSKAVSH